MIKKNKEEERREMERFKGKKQNPNPLFSCVWVWKKTLALRVNQGRKLPKEEAHGNLLPRG